MEMKIAFRKLSFLFILALGITMISCGDDEDPIVIDPGTDGINVADGLYLALEGQDPSSTAQMVSEVVEDEGFAAQDRDGFVAGYMFLEAGSYNVVQITAKEVTATIGGVAETVTDDGSSCDFNDYSVVSTATDGPAFSVATSGLYKVTHDQMKSELVMYQITDASIIGSATENGWGTDTPLTGSVSSDGASWSASGIILRSGEWKVRFNCRWSLDRRTDSSLPLSDIANGYQMFTNFGGTTNSLETGGSNIQQEEDAEYTVTVNWDPRDGFSLVTERTGDAPEITFNPNDFQMGVVGNGTNGEDLDGDGTEDGWQSDRNLFHKFDNNVHSWYGVVTFRGEGLYKFRANDDWDFNLGGALDNLTSGGDNIDVPGEGAYYIVLSTADEGNTWTATVENVGWAVIGDGSPSAAWDTDTFMTANGNVGGISTYVVSGDFTTAEWKFRAGGDWPLNLGGDLSFLTLDGGNIALGMPGNYTVTLSFDGEVYTATVE